MRIVLLLVEFGVILCIMIICCYLLDFAVFKFRVFDSDFRERGNEFGRSWGKMEHVEDKTI